MKKRVWLILFFLCLIVMVVFALLPNSVGDAHAMIVGIAMVIGAFSLIAFFASLIMSKLRPKADVPSASAPVQPVPVPTPATVPQPSAPVQPRSVPTPDTVPQPSAQPAPPPKPAITTERVHVRGLDKYKDNIESVASENPYYDLSKRELIDLFPDAKVWQYDFDVKGELVPEPDNPYDPNAIMVQANGLCIGYVPKGSTVHIRKLMESGRIVSMDLDIGGGKYKDVYEDEDEDGNDRYVVDRDSRPYSAVLELHVIDKQNDIGGVSR